MIKPRNKPRIEMGGQKFGILTVIKPTHQSSWGDWRYKCLCDCGKYTEVGGANLRKGAVQSCGCLRFKFIKAGTRFGKLTVIRKQGKDAHGAIKYLCRCSCGNTKSIRGYSLWRGDSKSCGCQLGKHLYKHGQSHTREYSIIKNHRRYARKLKAKGFHTVEEILTKLENQNYLCYYCSKSIRRKYHRDHMFPLIRGGSDYISNIVLACPSCNLKKNTMTAEEFQIKE